MPDAAEMNALYQEWLEIPADRLPPNHYALLGLCDFESDETKIDAASKSRSAYLHLIAAGPKRKIVQEMLGQVAIARRTLMSSESRSEYNQSLRSESNVNADLPQVSLAPASERANPATTTDDVESIDRSASGLPASPRRRKPADWRYHGYSAAALLLIVGVVYWINRNPGGRRAAQARLTETVSNETSVSAAAVQPSNLAADDATPVSAQNDNSPPTRKANPNRITVSPAESNSKSPVARKRDTGSGLGSGLGEKFDSVLTDIASLPDSDSQPRPDKPKQSSGFRPMGGLSIGPDRPWPDQEHWIEELQAVDAFASKVGERFSIDPTSDLPASDLFDAQDDGLKIKTAKQENVYRLVDTQFQATPGAIIAITTSLSPGMRGEMQAGLEVDGIRIGIRPYKNGIEVVAQDRGEDARIDSVCKIKTATETSLLAVQRDPVEPDLIRWFVSTDDEAKTGTIGATALGETATIAIYMTPPTKESDRPLLIKSFKTRSSL